MAAIVVVAAACYARVLGHEFLVYDDEQYVVDNPPIRLGVTRAGIAWAMTSFDHVNWHPLTWLSHMLDVEVFGMWPGGHHLTNLILHVANSVLVFALFTRLVAGSWRPLVVAGLFALHPQHVESVAWVAERKDVLSTFFGLLTLIAYVDYARRSSPKRYLVVVLCYALGLMSKPMLVTLPAVMLLLDLWPLARWPATEGAKAGLRRCVLEKLPLFGLAAVASVLTVLAQSRGAMKDLAEVGLGARLANAVVAYSLYVGKTIWPVNLAVFYPRPQAWAVAAVVGSFAFLAAVTGLVLARVKKQPALAAGWFWFLGTLVPVIGIVQVGDQALADRYAYIPHIGLFVMLVWAVPALSARVAGVATTALLIASAAITAWQVSYWKDSLTLFQRAIAVTGGSATAHNNLGLSWFRARDFARSEDQFKKAIVVMPDYIRARMNLGLALLEQGKHADALAEAREAIRIAPENGLGHALAGRALADGGEHAKALPELQLALEKIPRSADPATRIQCVSLAVAALSATGRTSEAIEQCHAALRSGMDTPDLRNNLGALYAQRGSFSAAVEQFQISIRHRPGDVPARFNLGRAYEDLRKSDLAIAAYEGALRIDGAHVPTLRALSWLRATAADGALRNGPSAVELAERAARLTGRKNAQVLDALAAAKAEVGDYATAEKTALDAAVVARERKDEAFAKRIEEHAASYRARRPLRL